jgi:hypothetical protein
MKEHRAREYKVKRMFSPPAGRVFALQVAVSGQVLDHLLHDPIRRESKFKSTVRLLVPRDCHKRRLKNYSSRFPIAGAARY